MGLAIYINLANKENFKGDKEGLTSSAPPAARYQEAVEFRMNDLDRGWVRYTDGIKTTTDSGMTWTETDVLPEEPAAGSPSAQESVSQSGSGASDAKATGAQAAGTDGKTASPGAPVQGQGDEQGKVITGSGAEGRSVIRVQYPTAGGGPVPPSYEWLRLQGDHAPLTSVRVQGTDYTVKQVQFMTDRIGWALVQDTGELRGKLLVTADGGGTWQTEVTEAVRAAIAQDKELLSKRQTEAAQYMDAEQAKWAFVSAWLLMPDTASPGDTVLVRHSQAGEVQWQGKTYALQPYGAGFFTFLPIGMDVKPGSYAIGDQSLKIVAKRFETQYLKVTEEMNSMRQDTKRIDADQQKINAARSKSQPEFLFQGPFVVPVEGILTTPYGYTRYVNGKFSGSHMAIDLAAKEGTPIKATNDGIVALADSLYLTGNSIYLDHGMGLFSQYAHLSKLNVKTGDRVKKGDIIGLVGTTGFSTGPHLHFTFWVHNVQANPNLFMDKTPFGWGGKQP
ncbi:M23 family metallopeptidase [Paenibacillus filicis]|uniref:M23 family metallopeptidase n=1 Tax=Paenibacillus filicis TaxID=669464 RepID=A0ABU9DNG0_9BACL